MRESPLREVIFQTKNTRLVRILTGNASIYSFEYYDTRDSMAEPIWQQIYSGVGHQQLKMLLQFFECIGNYITGATLRPDKSGVDCGKISVTRLREVPDGDLTSTERELKAFLEFRTERMNKLEKKIAVLEEAVSDHEARGDYWKNKYLTSHSTKGEIG